jgi:hypothetical protein
MRGPRGRNVATVPARQLFACVQSKIGRMIKKSPMTTQVPATERPDSAPAAIKAVEACRGMTITPEQIKVARKLLGWSQSTLAACRTEPFRDWVSGVFGHVCRAEYAVRAPSALRFSRACRDGPLSVAVNCAPGLPAQSGRGEDEHSLQIPGHRHQTPFAANFIEPAQ